MAAQLSVGLDLGSSSIKVVTLEREKTDSPLHLATASLFPIPLGGVFSDATTERDIIAASLKKLFQDMKIATREVIVALPETQVFTRVIEVPPLSDNELESALKWQADQYIPLPLSEVTMDFAILSKPATPKGKMQVLLVAAPLTVIDRTTALLTKADLVPLAVETEIIAGVRSFTTKSSEDSIVMIVDSGATTTGFSIVKSGVLLFTHTTSIAGEAITRAIQSAFNFEHTQAEEYKKVYGMDEQHFQGKLFQAIRPIIDSIMEEIRKSIIFFQSKNSNSSPRTIILSGGTALLPGLVPYIANALSVEVQIGNPWTSIATDSRSVVTLPRGNEALFAVATGLAIGAFIDRV